MKKLVLAFVAGLFAFGAFSQNIQLHYDMGKDRGYLTSTVEMFRPDKTGNTFFFIDFDYGVNWPGVDLAYFEIARCFKLGKSPFSWHAEYNGGLFQDGEKNAHSINDAWLTGIDYSLNAQDFSRGISLKALYKNIGGLSDDKFGTNSFQLTAVWYLNFAKGKMRFNGFADFWKETHTVSNDGFQTNFQSKKYIFLAEPQIWYNISPKFAAGSEIEISNNFSGNAGFMINPCASLKYTF